MCYLAMLVCRTSAALDVHGAVLWSAARVCSQGLWNTPNSQSHIVMLPLSISWSSITVGCKHELRVSGPDVSYLQYFR